MNPSSTPISDELTLPYFQIVPLDKFTDIYEMHYSGSERYVWCAVDKSAPEESKRYAWLKLHSEMLEAANKRRKAAPTASPQQPKPLEEK